MAVISENHTKHFLAKFFDGSEQVLRAAYQNVSVTPADRTVPFRFTRSKEAELRVGPLAEVPVAIDIANIRGMTGYWLINGQDAISWKKPLSGRAMSRKEAAFAVGREASRMGGPVADWISARAPNRTIGATKLTRNELHQSDAVKRERPVAPPRLHNYPRRIGHEPKLSMEASVISEMTEIRYPRIMLSHVRRPPHGCRGALQDPARVGIISVTRNDDPERKIFKVGTKKKRG
ncbi:hypothetical protein EI94DRAFT_1783386 [Lactarius quietus]|nr:hypothetical protein EI94DRAFT_1783386 [Lactarius quietus]